MEKQNRKSGFPSLLVLSSLALAILVFLPTLPISAHGQLVGLVCISNVTLSCPSQPANFSGAVGSQFTVRVVIQGSDTFNGFDIFVKVDPAVLNPVDASVAGTVLPNVFVAAVCINGQPVIGTCLQPGNGPGVVEVAAVGGEVPAPATGLLFSITYQVVSAGSTVIGFQTGPCDGYTTTSNDNFCVVVVNAGVIVPENLQTGSIGPDFTLTATPISLTIVKGSSGTSTITVTSVGGFAGTITLTASVSPEVKRGPMASLNPTSVEVSSSISGISSLTVNTARSTPLGAYVVTVTGSSGTLSHSISVTVTVVPH